MNLWSAYLANESSNNWCGWFDQSGAAACKAGAVLEGTIELVGELGALPAVCYLALGHYQTQDNCALSGQTPAGNGNIEFDEFLALDLETAGVTMLPAALRLALDSIYPNPFNAGTQIRFSIPQCDRTRISIIDLTGREICCLTDAVWSSGRHALNLSAAHWPSGIYIVRLQAGTDSITRKIILLR